MLLQGILPDAEGLGDLIVVAVLVDLPGDLEFPGGEVEFVFQEGQDVREVSAFRLGVGNLVQDCIQVHTDGLEEKLIFAGEGSVLFGAEQGEDAEKLLLVDAGVLHGIEDMEFSVAVDVKRRIQTLLILQKIAFPDKAWLSGVKKPQEMIFICYLHVFVFCFAECFRNADGACKPDGVRFCRGISKKDAGVAVGDHHFQAQEELGLDFVEACTGIEIVDHIVYHQEAVFFHMGSPFFAVNSRLLSSYEISILSYILKIKYIYLKSVNLTPEIKHCIRTGKRIVYQYKKIIRRNVQGCIYCGRAVDAPFFCFRKKSCFMQGGISVERVCPFWCRKKGEKKMNTGLIAILILLVIIVGAIATRRCVEFLIGGSLLAAIFMYGKDFLPQWCTLIQEVLAENVWIVLVCGLFGSLIALLQESKGTFGFQRLVSKFCDTERKTLLTTFVMGILIFVDDYLNVLSIGVCMKGVCDKRKIPREALAYMLDATGAPVCVLLPFSTWAVFYASLFIDQASVKALGFKTGMEAYIHAIPYCFYPIITIAIVFLFALGVMPKLGAMKKAYQRVAETGKVYSDASRKYNHDDRKGYEEDGNIWNFVIPMGVLVAIAIATSNLLMAVVVSLLVCFVLYVPQKVVALDDFFNLVVRGFADMLPILILLVIAFVLQKVTEGMGMTDFIISVAKPLLWGPVFPAIAFILVAALTFTTGSLWGMSAVVAPIVFPLGAAISANPILIMAAIISGGAFGSHACFYTDATLLSSQSAGIDNMEHALTQLPYVIIASVLTVVGFLICGFVM